MTLHVCARIFFDLCCSATDADVESLKIVWLNEHLISEICTCLKDISIAGKDLQDEYVETIDYFLRGINHYNHCVKQLLNV